VDGNSPRVYFGGSSFYVCCCALIAFHLDELYDGRGKVGGHCSSADTEAQIASKTDHRVKFLIGRL
jgi:hypothetical protein